jgi:hypothetical protein
VYDVRCYDLAKDFLKDGGWTHSEDIHRLAQAIQDTIEDFIADLENGPQTS